MRTSIVLIALLIIVAVYLAGMWYGVFGELEGPGIATGVAVPEDVIVKRADAQQSTAVTIGVTSPKQILFGDLHVHTTYSADAFIQSLPMNNGEGSHPLADACDFARYCSALDFWSINDHAESLSPRAWSETKQSVRQCNAIAGDASNPDVVTFLGWEWSQTGSTPDNHYGHRNVIFRDTAEESVPVRPIGSMLAPNKEMFRSLFAHGMTRLSWPLYDIANRQMYFNFFKLIDEWADVPFCEAGIPVRDLPPDCSEAAPTPRELFAKLDEWGFESTVIPHGSAWGLIAPPGSSWDAQLRNGDHDPKRQTLIELYSGHGNSEEYRDWRAVDIDTAGSIACPQPSADYMPSCWRAGEIVGERCAAAGIEAIECERREAAARRAYVEAGKLGFLTVPGQTPDDWLDAGQCRDCFLPAFNLRPDLSVQYALATGAETVQDESARFRFGIIGSSDIHRARPGVGYKEFARHGMTDARGPRDAAWAKRLAAPQQPALPQSVPVPEDLQFSALSESERRAGNITTGGLVAVHAEGRDRDSIWAALKRKEVYGTSGPRILLWFDLLNSSGGTLPMGDEILMHEIPRFRVRAVGAFKQRPGCPTHSLSTLGPEKLQRLCFGECYHPSDERHLITRIEVVRIRPRMQPDEAMPHLIESPWKTFACPRDSSGCTIEFSDPQFVQGGRDTVYYVRAIQEATAKINGDNLRCEYDAAGNCIKANLCSGGFPTEREDDCLADVEERAWSSPIFVDFADLSAGQ